LIVSNTNVLVSALLFGGTPGRLFDLSRSGRIRPLMSREMVEEFLRVLTYPKFRLTEEEIHYLLYTEVLPVAEMVRARPGPVMIAGEPSEDMFLRCAAAGRAKYIVSGDRHRLGLKTHRRAKSLAAADFLSRVRVTSL
jgi:putative PIN family toxin of toxin-antitoxin system